MNNRLIERFMLRWEKYFPNAELPICFYFTDNVSEDDLEVSKNEYRCLIGNLNRVREGYPYVYDLRTPGCPGGKKYSGFTDKIRPDFEYFLSCGIPGRVEGERYKQSPELVNQHLASFPTIMTDESFLIFKRIDKLSADEQPEAFIFFAAPDILAGLFTLANFDTPDSSGVIAPMGSGCASIIQYPLIEAQSEISKCILGMFDVSARPYMPANTLTFSVSYKRLGKMTDNMDESFLITDSWKKIKDRL